MEYFAYNSFACNILQGKFFSCSLFSISCEREGGGGTKSVVSDSYRHKPFRTMSLPANSLGSRICGWNLLNLMILKNRWGIGGGGPNNRSPNYTRCIDW